jgi:hypothetical protein
MSVGLLVSEADFRLNLAQTPDKLWRGMECRKQQDLREIFAASRTIGWIGDVYGHEACMALTGLCPVPSGW